MAGSNASEGQAVWQPGGAEEDSRLREGNRHLHLAYDEEEEEVCFVEEFKSQITLFSAPVETDQSPSHSLHTALHNTHTDCSVYCTNFKAKCNTNE